MTVFGARLWYFALGVDSDLDLDDKTQTHRHLLTQLKARSYHEQGDSAENEVL